MPPSKWPSEQNYEVMALVAAWLKGSGFRSFTGEGGGGS